MKQLTTLLALFLFPFAYGQTYSKWPYVGENIPPYLAVTGGIETINSHAYLIGLAYSPGEIFSTAFEGFGGIRACYKQDMGKPTNQGIETDLCIAAGVIAGLNYNYNKVDGNTVHGFKPFIGLSLFHVQFYYGYCFYKDSRDTQHSLVHNRFTLSFILPVAKTTRRD
jgi:hypothetical protein